MENLNLYILKYNIKDKEGSGVAIVSAYEVEKALSLLKTEGQLKFTNKYEVVYITPIAGALYNGPETLIDEFLTLKSEP